MPIDRGIIDQHLQKLGESTNWWDFRELRDLPAILDTDEQIRAISRGHIASMRWVRRKWLIVVTNRRLLFVRSDRRASWRQHEVSVATITGVRTGMGVRHGRVIVYTTGKRYRLVVPRPDAYRLSEALAGVAKSKAEVGGFGPTRMVRRMVDHVLALPVATLNPAAPAAPVPVPAPADPGMERRLTLLEDQVRELQQQVDFLEKLLQQRQLESIGAP